MAKSSTRAASSGSSTRYALKASVSVFAASSGSLSLLDWISAARSNADPASLPFDVPCISQPFHRSHSQLIFLTLLLHAKRVRRLCVQLYCILILLCLTTEEAEARASALRSLVCLERGQ